MNGIGLVVALVLLHRSLKRCCPNDADRAYKLMVLVLPFAWLGAHVTDMIVNDRPFTGAGFVFYGGLVTGAALYGLVGICVLSARSLLIAANAAVVPLLVAHAFGRIGCFAAGCCYGSPISGCSVFDRHPTQLYEAVFLTVLAGALSVFGAAHQGTSLRLYLIIYPTFRFGIEFLRDDARGGLWGMSTSQIVSILIVMGVFAHCASRTQWGSARARSDPGNGGNSQGT